MLFRIGSAEAEIGAEEEGDVAVGVLLLLRNQGEQGARVRCQEVPQGAQRRIELPRLERPAGALGMAPGKVRKAVGEGDQPAVEGLKDLLIRLPGLRLPGQTFFQKADPAGIVLSEAIPQCGEGGMLLLQLERFLKRVQTLPDALPQIHNILIGHKKMVSSL